MTPNGNRIQAHLGALAAYTTTPDAGCTRLTYSPEYRAACDYVAERARSLGMSVRTDAVGNLRARLPGREDLPAVMVGSHLDTVINGGNFDGILGVVCGLEAVETLVTHGVRPRRPVELTVFAEEEGTTFRCPLAGSKALTGQLGVDDLKTIRNERGRSWYDTLVDYGLSPDELPRDRIRPGDLHAMLELHIEQGAVLESLLLPVGIVDRIAGSENHRVRLAGRANHAGTTPMHLRLDTLTAAAEMILAIERIASAPDRPDTVATVGRIHCTPNAVNVIPGRVEFSIDVRDVEDARISDAANAMRGAVERIAGKRRMDWEMELTGRSAPHSLSGRITARLRELAERARIRYRQMPSGALHDAAMLCSVTDVGMIFVPSREGRSHTPKEWTDLADIEVGAGLLLDALLALGEE